MNDTPAPCCRRHSARPAHWNCPACQLDLCTDCKPYAEQIPLAVNCPLCQGAMAEVQPAVPRSEQLKKLILAPARPVTIALLAVVAVILSAAWLGGLRLVLSVPALLLISAWLVVLARHAAENRPGFPALGELLDSTQFSYIVQTFWFSLPFLLIFGLAGLRGSGFLFALGLLACAIALPAILMATVAANGAINAFDATHAGRIIRILEHDYVALAALAVAAVFLLSLGAHLAGLAGSVLALAGAWLLAIFAHQTGRLLYRHRRRLGYPAGIKPGDRPRPPTAEIYEPALLLADADTLLATGQQKSARLQLGAALTRYPDDPDLNLRFDELIRANSEQKGFLNHLERRLRRLVRKGQYRDVADLWQHHSASLDGWMPRSKDTRYRLALELDQRGEHSTAFRMLIGLTPDEPRFNHQAEAWLEAARILDQRLGQSPKAGELRKIVMQRYPQQARRWLERRQAAAPASTDRPEDRIAAFTTAPIDQGAQLQRS